MRGNPTPYVCPSVLQRDNGIHVLAVVGTLVLCIVVGWGGVDSHIRTVRAELQPSLVAEQLQTSVQQPERQKKKPVRFGRPTIGSRARNPIQAPGALVESSVEESSVAERIPVEKAASSSSSSPPSPKKKYFILNPDTWELEEISESETVAGSSCCVLVIGF